jgi:N-acyl-D-aspartate/D-glutamate deacylase
MAHEWNIRPRGRSCTVCSALFADGQECVSSLFEAETGYDRSDFCLPCWERRTDSRTPFSLWQGVFTAPGEARVKAEPLHRETAETLLRRLVALEDPANLNVVYVLAVMLERKRILVERDAKPHEGGGILRIYEHRPTGDTFIVLDPQLKLDAIGEVQRQVVAMLTPGGSVSAGSAAPAAGTTPEVALGRPDFDLLLRGGQVVDGTGAPVRPVDVGIRDGRIVALGTIPAEATYATRLDVAGCLVTPGFIDAHSHSDAYLAVEPDAPSKIRQGVTTEVVGQCGCSAAPLLGAARHSSDWFAILQAAGLEDAAADNYPWRSVAAYRHLLAAAGHAPNVVCLAGHNKLRAGVMGFAGRAATEDETREMVRRLEQAMDEGASGFSTGLIYVPGRFSAPEEIQALARAAAARKGIYATHMRSEGDRIEAAVAEVLDIARTTGVRVQISHLKTAGKANWGKLEGVLGQINAARAAGCAVQADRYPYCVSATSLDSRLPGWAQADGNAAILARLRDSRSAARIVRELSAGATPETWEQIIIGGTTAPELARFRGATMAAIAREWRCAPAEAFIKFLVADQLNTDAFFSSMSEENLRRIYAEPWVMVGSDASIRATTGPLSRDFPHPRAYGTFARFLRMALDGALPFGIEEAVRRLTLLPAQAFGLAGRGQLVEGAWADLAVFDPATVRETSTFSDPHHYAEGFRCTLVNGQIAFDGRESRQRPGHWLVRRD